MKMDLAGLRNFVWISAAITAHLTAFGQITVDAFNPGFSGPVYSFALQPDGQIIVGGGFTYVGSVYRSGLARVSSEGVFDGTFTPLGGSITTCIALQPDLRILVGKSGGGYPSPGRFLPSGEVDSSFLVRADGSAYCMALQRDGSLVLGGNFRNLNSQPHRNLGRVDASGLTDTNLTGQLDSAVWTTAIQPDDKILVGGTFATIDGMSFPRLVRLNPDGSVDDGFNTGGMNGSVQVVVVQPDGKILLGGSFTFLGNKTRRSIGRLNPDGSVDDSFNPGANFTVYALALQTDGKILVGGDFTQLASQTRKYIGRLNPNGSLDPTFNPGANATVYALGIQADGKVLAGGAFTNLAGQPRAYLGRLTNPDPASHELSFDESAVRWLRGGSSPEVWRVTFESSTNGNDWSFLGEGIRMDGGWQVAGLTLASGISIRARGFTTGGQAGAGSWFVEDVAGAPAITSISPGRTNNAGSSALLTVAAGGTAPLYYQWFKDGARLTEGQKFTGTQTPWLSVRDLLGADAGNYYVVVSNGLGVATSSPVRLWVVEPVITRQPSTVWANAGHPASLTVEAAATAPVGYQWWRGGAVLSGATESSLVFPGVNTGHSGQYFVVVTSTFGATTSLVANLCVNNNLPDDLKGDATGEVSALALQPNGDILVGGSFTSLGGEPRSRLGRFSAEGRLDATFDPNIGGKVSAFAIQTNGKILVGGSFSTVATETRLNLARLSTDGTLDGSFTNWTDGEVWCLLALPDGKVIVGGRFSSLSGQTHLNLARLRADGTTDPSFTAGTAEGTVKAVYCCARQADGKLLIGGSFFKLNGVPRSNLGRLNADGTIDTTFGPSIDAPVRCLVVQPDGKIIVTGEFVNIAGQTGRWFCRLRPDGTFDNSFQVSSSSYVWTAVAQADGAVLAGGSFAQMNGAPFPRLVRVFTDGALDPSFVPAPDNSVSVVALQPDGNIVLGGFFTNTAGVLRGGLARLLNTSPPSERLGFDGSRFTWYRSGSTPELYAATFAISTNNLTWQELGEGSRITGAWVRAVSQMPATFFVRTRGFVASGTSTWFYDQVFPVTQSIRLLAGGDGDGLVSNRFGFHISAAAGDVVIIQSSTNLLDWESIATNTIGTEPPYLSFPVSSEPGRRFFRGKSTR
jgi:uncharacterized delta-60 repeat protein